MGLVLDEIIVEGERLELGTEPLSLSMPRPGSLEVRLTEDSLARFLNEKAPAGLKEFKVRLADGVIQIEATASLIISVKIGATCRLTIENESKLVVELVRMDAIGGSGMQNIVQRQLDAINPVLDADHLPVAATFKSVEIDQQLLVVYGTVAPKTE